MGIENKANSIYGRLKKNADNPVSVNYKYSDMSNILNDLYNNSKETINRTSAYDMGRARQGAAARNANLTGSLKEDIIGNAGQGVLRNKYNALGSLEAGRFGSNMNAMQMDNRNTLMGGQLKNQALSQLARFLPTMMEAENQPGTLDDIFAGLNTASGLLSIPTGGTSTIASSIIDLFK